MYLCRLSMTESISCGFTRVAARHFSTRYYRGRSLPKGSIPKIMADYNQHFNSNPSLKVNYSTAAKRFPAICRRFNMKWRSATGRKDYLEAFSLTAWGQLSPEEKKLYTITNCTQCQKGMPNVYHQFPAATKMKTIPSIEFTHEELRDSLAKKCSKS